MVRFWQFFKRVFNIQVQENQGMLLFSSAISGLIYTYSNPPIVKEIISKLPPEWISFEGAWFCLSALVIGAVWNGKEREMYDNTASIFRNGIALVGFGIAIFAMPSLNAAILLWGIGCIFDDIGWIIVYRKTRRSIIESKEGENENDKL